MSLIKPHAYAELPEVFYNLQNWEGFKNPSLVIENAQLKKERGYGGNTSSPPPLLRKYCSIFVLLLFLLYYCFITIALRFYFCLMCFFV